MDRRNFLKTGGIALLGSLATGSAMAVSYTHLTLPTKLEV